MKTKTLTFIVIALLVSAFALSTDSVAAGKAKGRAKFELPPNAVAVGQNVYYLGKAKDKGKDVEGYAFVRRKDNPGKPGTECGNNVCEPGENANKCPADCGGGEDPADPVDPAASGCYEFLARGAKWRVVEPYIVNPFNSRGLDEVRVAEILSASIDAWELAAETNILGDGTTTTDTLEADTVAIDGLNEVYFADIGEPGVIGITIIWGIFGGPPPARKLVEWDQIYDDTDFDWSEDCTAEDCTCDDSPDCVSEKMDFMNIAIHELGHSCGLGDLYTSDCMEQTMYGYATEGETKKTDLDAGDIAGIKALYK